MQLKPGHIFKRFIILMMMALVCLPCPAKRTIKELLDIPAHHTSGQPLKQVTCPAFVQHTGATAPVYVLQQATGKTASGGYPANSRQQKAERLRNTTLHSARPFAGNTPIYIRHRCILI